MLKVVELWGLCPLNSHQGAAPRPHWGLDAPRLTAHLIPLLIFRCWRLCTCT